MIASRLPKLSSTTRITPAASGSAGSVTGKAAQHQTRAIRREPGMQRDEQLGGVDRLRDVPGGACVDAAVALGTLTFAVTAMIGRSTPPGCARIAPIVS